MNSTRKLIYSAICLALCMALPFLTGQIPNIGMALAPMHIPVLICGFVCGWPFGAAIGFAAPLLRFLLFGMPPIFPMGLSMAFELAAYGAVSGFLYKRFNKKDFYIYPVLVSAMLGGRVVWGLAMFLFTAINQGSFTFSMFLAGAFVNAVPGIICHLLIVPLIVYALKKAGFILNG